MNDHMRWPTAILGWLVAGVLAFTSCDRHASGGEDDYGDNREQLASLRAAQITTKAITVKGGGSITLAGGVIRIVDAQGKTAVLDATGVHVTDANPPAH